MREQIEEKENGRCVDARRYYLFVCIFLNSVKLGSKGFDRLLNQADNNFIDNATENIEAFHKDHPDNSVLLFPAVSNYRRFLIHKAAEAFKQFGLASFSIGRGDLRRTVICYEHQIISKSLPAEEEAMGVEHQESRRPQQSGEGPGPYLPPALRRLHHSQEAQPIREPPAKPRRPDRAVYVPKARRTTAVTGSTAVPSQRTVPPISPPQCAGSPLTQNIIVSPERRKVPDRNFCNVYKPPAARVTKSSLSSNRTSIRNSEGETFTHCLSSDEYKTDTDPRNIVQYLQDESTCPSDSEVFVNQFEDSHENAVDCSAYFATDSGHPDNLAYHPAERLGLTYSSDPPTEMRSAAGKRRSVDRESARPTASPVIAERWPSEKDEDGDRKELERATEEINRSNRRLIKQSFISDVLHISDPLPTLENRCQSEDMKIPQGELLENATPEGNNKSGLSEEGDFGDDDLDEWERLVDASGEGLEGTLLAELTASVGRVRVRQSVPSTSPTPSSVASDDRSFSHVLEVYNFPAEFTNNDLLSVFSDFKDTGFEIKWVDDNHALAVFGSSKIADEVLNISHPIVRTRPLWEATSESRQKAKKCAEFLQPYRARPETCAALARRLVTGALGLRLATAPQERLEERRLLTEAREKKRQAALHREAAWDGSLADC